MMHRKLIPALLLSAGAWLATAETVSAQFFNRGGTGGRSGFYNQPFSNWAGNYGSNWGNYGSNWGNYGNYGYSGNNAGSNYYGYSYPSSNWGYGNQASFYSGNYSQPYYSGMTYSQPYYSGTTTGYYNQPVYNSGGTMTYQGMPMYNSGGTVMSGMAANGSTTQGQSLYGPSAMDANRVKLQVTVPTSTAQLWVENAQTDGTGMTRSFVSPPLESGSYTYTVRAKWMQNDREVTREKTVRVEPGREFTVSFSDAAGSGTPDSGTFRNDATTPGGTRRNDATNPDGTRANDATNPGGTRRNDATNPSGGTSPRSDTTNPGSTPRSDTTNPGGTPRGN